MTSSTYVVWPFRSFTARSVEETERWWQECYLPSRADRILLGQPHWRLIAGGSGSGKSVTLAKVERSEAAHSFIVRYPPARWPGSKHAFVKGGGHLAQIMAAAALAVRDHLTTTSAQIAQLSPGQCVFIRWLLEKHIDSRAFVRWVDGLPQAVAQHLTGIEQDDLYPTTTDPGDVHGQIDALVSLARRLGFQRVLVTIDLNQRDIENCLDNLGLLFEWLDLIHHIGFALLATVPSDAVVQADLIQRSRGRVSVINLDWDVAQVREIAQRHITAATRSAPIQLESLVVPPLLENLESFLRSEFNNIAPYGWVLLAETFLHLMSRPDGSVTPPFTLMHETSIKREYCARHFPIEVIPNKGIWRGPRLIRLDSQPLSFAEILWAKPTTLLNAEDPDLRRLARTKDYIHTLARRVREAIEPDIKNPIYLINDRGAGGYYFEHMIRSSSPIGV